MRYDDLPLFAELAEPERSPATMICDDVLHWAETYTGPKFHALLTDAPYEMSFMSKTWDSTGIAFKPETWKALAQHLLPGAFGMCFASARGWHRLACAIEDAGLRILPSIFGWGFGSGFPKSSRIDMAMDKRIGSLFSQPWTGHRYGGQALKPALEPIIVFQVPYQGQPVSSITETGAGSLNIDGGRIPLADDDQKSEGGRVSPGQYTNQPFLEHRYRMSGIGNHNRLGRWPPNFALCHTDQCVQVGRRQVHGHAPERLIRKSGSELGQLSGWNAHRNVDTSPRPEYGDAHGQETVAAWDCAPHCPVAVLDQQAGPRERGRFPGRQHVQPGSNGTTMGRGWNGRVAPEQDLDAGSTSRFFFIADWSLDIAERLAQAELVFYCAKASKAERDAGLLNDPQRRTQAYGVFKVQQCHVCGTRHKASGPSGPGLICGHEDWSWVDMTIKGSRGGASRNHHPTVKPLKLTQWLATLLLPPAAYAPRRILCPFSGSGSEGIGAILAGWDVIVMIEQDASYVELAQQRLAYWQHRQVS
jgi:hypothetical protein